MLVVIENRGLRKWVLADKVARPGQSVTLTEDERANLGGRSPAALVALKDGELVETLVSDEVQEVAPADPAPEPSPEKPKHGKR